VYLNWSVSPQASEDFSDFRYEKRMANGVTYYFNENEIAGDGTDANQKWISIPNFTRSLQFAQNGFGYQLSANASKKGLSLETASIDTLLALAGNPGLVVPGYRRTMESWNTTFRNGSLSLNISISPPPFDLQEINQYLAVDGIEVATTADGLQFGTTGRDRSAGDPMSAFLFAKTEIGTVTIRGGVPYHDRANVPADSLDYIDIDLVRAVVAWVKGG
jgi:hypothetical protein